MAKVMGSLASKRSAEEGEEMSGILVKRNFNYHILSPEVRAVRCKRVSFGSLRSADVDVPIESSSHQKSHCLRTEGNSSAANAGRRKCDGALNPPNG